MTYDGDRQISCGVEIDIFGYPLPEVKNPNRVFYADGAAFLIRKDVFKELGGFDPAFFMYAEDIDLSWRARLYGYRIQPLPTAIVYHAFGATAGGGIIDARAYVTSVIRRYFSERNTIRMLLKNYTLGALLAILPLYFLMNIGESLLFALSGHLRAAAAYGRAWVWNIMNIGSTLRERKIVQRRRTVSDAQIVRQMYKTIAKIQVFRRVGIPEVK